MGQPPTLPAELQDRLQALAVLGQGTAGQVFRARDRELGREVVVKILRTGTYDPAGMEARFRREARTLAALDHPRVLRLLDYGVIGDQVFTIHPFLPGRDLRRVLGAGGLDPARVARLLADAFEGLAYVHEREVLHRDLKPENLFVDSDDRLMLIDFGLAKGEGDETLTKTATLLGTPIYMAPELFTDALWSPAADVYALGVVAYELLAGTNPFRGTSLTDTATRHLELVPPPPTSGREPALDRLVTSLLAKPSGERPSAASTLERLRRLESPAEPTGPARGDADTQDLPAPPPAAREDRTTQPLPAHPAPPPRLPMPAVVGSSLLGVAAVTMLLLPGSGPGPQVRGPPPSALASPSAPPSQPASPPTPGPLVGSAVPSPLRDLPATARASLNQAFDAHGRDPDWGDPARWSDHEGQVRGPDALRRWLAEGGRPEALPRDFRRALSTIDSDAFGLGALPIFGPLATATPSPPRLGAEESLLDHHPRPEWLADGRATWRGATITALGEAVAAATHAHQILSRPDAPGSQVPDELRLYLPEAGLARTISGSRGLAFDRVTLAGPEARRALAAWMRDGVVAATRFFFCGARSLRTEEADTWMAHQIGRWTHSLLPLFFSHIAYAPVEVLMGLEPEHPTEAMVALEIMIRQARVRRNLAPLTPAFTARYRAVWTKAMAIARTGPESTSGTQLVLKRLIQTPTDLISEEQWSQLFDVAVRELKDLPSAERASHAALFEHYVPRKEERSDFPDVAGRLAILRRR